jgi:hypothetical protein
MYVEPAYKMGNFPIPDKDTWMREIEKTNQDPSQYYKPLGWRNMDHYSYSVIGQLGKIFDGMSRAGIMLDRMQSMAVLKLSQFFSPSEYKPEFDRKAMELQPREDLQKIVAQNVSNHVFDDANFWLQTHPNQALSDKIGSLTGETIVQLPLYDAIDKGLIALKAGSKLTEVLESTSVGKFIGSRLTEAASGYLGSILQNGTPKENVEAALTFMGFGTALEGSGKVLTAGSSMLAKKFTANVLSIGGRPFQDAITDQAIQEMEHVANHPIDEHLPKLLNQIRDEDPVKFDLTNAEKGILNSISLIHFGKIYNELGESAKTAVRMARANQVKEAIVEAPIHLPDIAQANTENELAEQRKQNPQLDQTINYLEQKYGGKVSSELVDAEATDIKEQTGISNSQAATDKVGKQIETTQKENEEALSKAAEAEPKQYAELGMRSEEYFENPLTMKGKSGGFDYKDWLAGLDDKDFDSEVRDHVGNQPFFENPEHLMLWAYQYRDKMPAPFKNRIVERLQDLDPTGTPKSWAIKSKNMERHLSKLADTGKLFTEGNVFRSSAFESWGTKTKWQRQLNNQDLEKAEDLNLDKTLKPYTTNFPQDIKNAKQVLKNLQMLRRKAIDADEDLKLTTHIKIFGKDVASILKKKKVTQ